MKFNQTDFTKKFGELLKNDALSTIRISRI